MQSGKTESYKDSFFKDVYEVVRLIPKGKVTTYGAIGKFLGAKSSARLVGWAMNHAPEDVPAHRVVNRLGMLTGKFHFNPPERMEQMLKKEGIEVKDDQIRNFKESFWDPAVLEREL
jgi:methylated-DNA-protein-cysteine methyltransferase-like protein